MFESNWEYVTTMVQWVHRYGIDCNVPASILQATGHVSLSNMGICTSYFLWLPSSIFETFTWMILTYWTIGFATEASR
jgi:hypothetical protein